jgi:hypothetical protein
MFAPAIFVRAESSDGLPKGASDDAHTLPAMNTYCAVPLESGRWAVEWSVDGIVQGLTFGTFDLRR